jgi:DNA polymerase elongation subunit (family B)
MKILLLDIETSPNVAYVWGLFKETIPLVRLIESSETLCWAAKWYGSDEVMYDSIYESSQKKMIKKIHKLLTEADCVIHYYGSRFDIPTLNKEFLLHGLTPPAPYKQVDLCNLVRSKFKFVSNKLDYVAEQLGCGKKKETDFKLWVQCMQRDPEAWDKMKAYNQHDVVLLEKVYDKLKPWIKGHANHSLYSEDGLVCPNCGSGRYSRRGYAYTASAKYVRCQCKDCGAWFRTGKSLAHKPDKKFINV